MQVRPLPGFFEPFSALSHLLGAFVFTALSVLLVWRASEDRRRAALLSVFAFSTVLLLSMSGVFHMLPEGSRGRAVLGRLDKAAIFVLIAGTHTPIQGYFFRGISRWGVLTLVWVLAAAGITLFTVYYDHLPPGLGTSVYLALGWIAGTFGVVVWRRFGLPRIWMLFGGGVAYSIGAILLGLEWPTIVPGVLGPHELWHVAVLVALTLHWTFLFKHARLSIGPVHRRPGRSSAAGQVTVRP